jgi:hypothetical protein
MATLNGWLRLWVVVMVFWTVLVLSVGYVGWPSSYSLSKLEAEAEMPQEVVIVDGEGSNHIFPPGFDLERARSIVEEGGYEVIPLSPEGWNISGNPKVGETRDDAWHRHGEHTDVVERLESERQALTDRRVTHAQFVFMTCAIPPVFLYAFGWSVGWIRRGFRG